MSNLWDDHVEWLTSVTGDWFRKEHQAWITEKLQYIAKMNREAVADGYEGNNQYQNSHGPYTGDDIEWLAEEAQYFAEGELLTGTGDLTEEFASDALSEVEWMELAESWLKEKEK